MGRLACGAPVNVAAIVFDPRAATHLGQHFQVVSRPHPQALSFEQLAVFLEIVEPLLELHFDALDGRAHTLGPGDVVGGRENDDVLNVAPQLARHGVDARYALYFVAEQLDSQYVFFVSRVDLDGVAPDPELATDQVLVVALVLHVDEAAENPALVVFVTDSQGQDLLGVLLW